MKSVIALGIFACAVAGCASRDSSAPPAWPSHLLVERISTAVPFPRGIQIVDRQLYVLARGRVRESGGVDSSVDDRAGTIYRVDPDIAEPAAAGEVSSAVRGNGAVYAIPSSPPFKLFDRTLADATRDRETDRPYCTLRYDPITKNFYTCAFSGIDRPEDSPGGNFSKNTSDAIFRFDTRTMEWHEVERHNLSAGGNYPHHDPASRPPPHGWLNGPDNCLVVGEWLYCISKDNSLLVRYDLSVIAADPAAPAPPSHWVLGDAIHVTGMSMQRYTGHSMLAERDGYLYLGYRTSSTIVRFKLDEAGLPVQPIRAELVARFDPYDAKTRRSANLTDMVFDRVGNLYVVSAQPARVYRFRPDAKRIFDGRSGQSPPWADLSLLTKNPSMKSENLLVDDQDRLYVTSGDAYSFQNGSGGTLYRLTAVP